MGQLGGVSNGYTGKEKKEEVKRNRKSEKLTPNNPDIKSLARSDLDAGTSLEKSALVSTTNE